MNRLQCRAVTARYGERLVLRSVDLDVAAGEWIGVVGPNGAGKTTLLRVISGALNFDGEVNIDGSSLEDISHRDLARVVAVVPQTPETPLGMTVLEYVLLGRTPYISWWGSESSTDVAKAAAVLARLDLSDFADRPIDSLSGGERQRVVLGRALAQEGLLLLLDEPTTALDIGHQQVVLEHVDELRRKQGVAVVSAVHDLTLAAQYADRLLLIREGEVVTQGSPGEVLTADNLAMHYRASVTVLTDEDGHVVVAPRRV